MPAGIRVNPEEKVFYDSSVAFYCAGCIGYRWAVKVTQALAENKVYGLADALLFQEILDRFHLRREEEPGEIVAHSFRRLVHEVVPVTAEDFDLSRELFLRHPAASPRILLRTAVMKRNGVDKICATFAGGFEDLPGIERVNLMEKL